MKGSIEQELRNNGFVLMHTVGISMRPMLHERREQNLIRPPQGLPRANDVVLYRRQNGQYVLHRIIRSRGGVLYIRGDNCYLCEKVPADRIIGVLRGFYRKDRYIDCEKALLYRGYVWLWRLVYPIRYLCHHIHRGLWRLCHRKWK